MLLEVERVSRYCIFSFKINEDFGRGTIGVKININTFPWGGGGRERGGQSDGGGERLHEGQSTEGSGEHGNGEVYAEDKKGGESGERGEYEEDDEEQNVEDKFKDGEEMDEYTYRNQYKDLDNFGGF